MVRHPLDIRAELKHRGAGTAYRRIVTQVAKSAVLEKVAQQWFGEFIQNGCPAPNTAGCTYSSSSSSSAACSSAVA